MKKLKKMVAILTAAMMSFSVFATTAWADSTSENEKEIIVEKSIRGTGSKSSTVSATAITLEAGEADYSDDITFNISGVPTGATITKIEVKVGSYTNAGNGVIVVDEINLTSPDNTEYTGVWSAGPKWTITNILSSNANGQWKFNFHGVNISSYWYAYLQYNNIKLTITYRT